MTEAVLIAVIVMTAIVLIVRQIVRLFRARMLHHTIRDAIARDSASLPALLDGIDEKPAASNDDRTGLVLVALGLALALLGLVQADVDLAGAALFPGLVGAALLLRHYVLGTRDR